MDVIRIASKKMVTTTPGEKISSIVDTMAKNKIGILLVCDDDKLAGILSERDVIRAIADQGAKALDMTVKDFMTAEVVTCNGKVHPHDVLTEMYNRKIRHMPVVDNGNLKGLVSSTDIIRYLASNTSPDEQAMMWAKLSV